MATRPSTQFNGTDAYYSGALTISELCLAGKSAILVPSPNVAEDHQTQNALALVNVDAAMMVNEADAVGGVVSKALDLLKDQEKAKGLEKQIRLLAMPNASDEIAHEILNAMQS